MKNYFNKCERDTHLVILFMAELVSNFKRDCNALTEEEQEHLSVAETHLKSFNESIYERFGDAYKRKIKGTLQTNTVRVGSKYGQDTIVEHYSAEDLSQSVKDMIAFHCCGCEKCDFKSCPTYAMAVACDVFGENEQGCPYKW